MSKLGILYLAIILLLFLSCGPSTKQKTSVTRVTVSQPSGFLEKSDLKLIPFNIEGRQDSEPIDLKVNPREMYSWNMLVYKETLVSFGLYSDDKDNRNDIVISKDGIKWEKAAGNVFQTPIVTLSGGVYRDSLVFMGSLAEIKRFVEKDGDLFFFDQNSSEANAFIYRPFRSMSAIISFKNNLLIVGGDDEERKKATIMIIDSTLQISYTNETILPPLHRPLTWVSKESIYIDNGLGNFFESTDGILWQKIEIEKPFSDRFGYTIIARNNEWFLIGGYMGGGAFRDAAMINDVWKTVDFGRTWNQIAIPDEHQFFYTFPARQDAFGGVFKGKLIYGGGNDGKKDLFDFWVSDDGVTWEELK